MRVLIVGLGNQGKKRMAVADQDVVATVDPVSRDANYTAIDKVSLDSFDAALVCTPNHEKPAILDYLLSRGKHVLVEKPLLASDGEVLCRLAQSARSAASVCYTAYNHRLEPHIVRLKELLDGQTLGDIYSARLFYGNGTALDVRQSPWRDEGLGVLEDLGSHLLDLVLYLFGRPEAALRLWSARRFETRSLDHVLFGFTGTPLFEMEATYLSWRNTFNIDILGEGGSAHINGLCKWGPSTFTVRKRVFPSGVPDEEIQTIECPDPTWALEYLQFKELCRTGGTNIENDQWINSVLNDIGREVFVK